MLNAKCKNYKNKLKIYKEISRNSQKYLIKLLARCLNLIFGTQGLHYTTYI